MTMDKMETSALIPNMLLVIVKIIRNNSFLYSRLSPDKHNSFFVKPDHQRFKEQLILDKKI